MAASPILIPNRSVIKEEKDLQTIDAVSNMNKSNYSAHTYEPLKPIESVINPSSNVTPKYPQGKILNANSRNVPGVKYIAGKFNNDAILGQKSFGASQVIEASVIGQNNSR